MEAVSSRGRLRALLLGLAVAGSALLPGPGAVAAGTPAASVAAAAPSAPAECAAIMPVGRVSKGMIGTGWTVVRGPQPRPIKVAVKGTLPHANAPRGTLPDAIAPGRAMIVVEVSDLPGSHFISKAGGIWAGMSGSPVYVRGKLIGAVAWGFTAAPSPIGGLTPASDMAGVLSYPAAGPAAGSVDTRLAATQRRALARMVGLVPAATASFRQLPLPLVVSGMRGRLLERFERRLERDGGSYVVVPGSRARRPTAARLSTPVPGGNFAALISYGDVTVSGVGTATWVCRDRALAFGHPMEFVGRSGYGANGADALAIVRDSTFGSFKLAGIGRPYGTVDQDRLAAIRADLTAAPRLIPVTSRVASVDLGTIRRGRSDVAMSQYLPDVAASHVMTNIDSTVDRVGDGTSLVSFTVRGRQESGARFTFTRTDRISSTYDVSGDTAWSVAELLFGIGANPYTDVTFEGFEADARVWDTSRIDQVRGVRVSVNGGPFRRPAVLSLAPGDDLLVRVSLSSDQGADRTVSIALPVPADVSGEGALVVAGGNDLYGPDCGEDPAACPRSFAGFLRQLAAMPRNDELVVQLVLYGESRGMSGPEVRRQLAAVVGGAVEIPAVVG